MEFPPQLMSLIVRHANVFSFRKTMHESICNAVLCLSFLQDDDRWADPYIRSKVFYETKNPCAEHRIIMKLHSRLVKLIHTLNRLNEKINIVNDEVILDYDKGEDSSGFIVVEVESILSKILSIVIKYNMNKEIFDEVCFAVEDSKLSEVLAFEVRWTVAGEKLKWYIQKGMAPCSSLLYIVDELLQDFYATRYNFTERSPDKEFKFQEWVSKPPALSGFWHKDVRPSKLLSLYKELSSSSIMITSFYEKDILLDFLFPVENLFHYICFSICNERFSPIFWCWMFEKNWQIRNLNEDKTIGVYLFQFLNQWIMDHNNTSEFFTWYTKLIDMFICIYSAVCDSKMLIMTFYQIRMNKYFVKAYATKMHEISHKKNRSKIWDMYTLALRSFHIDDVVYLFQLLTKYSKKSPQLGWIINNHPADFFAHYPHVGNPGRHKRRWMQLKTKFNFERKIKDFGILTDDDDNFDILDREKIKEEFE